MPHSVSKQPCKLSSIRWTICGHHTQQMFIIHARNKLTEVLKGGLRIQHLQLAQRCQEQLVYFNKTRPFFTGAYIARDNAL